MAISRTALGIYVSEERINMALLRKNGSGSVRLLKTAESPLPNGVVKNGNIEDHIALAKEIKKLKTNNRMNANRIAMSLTANPVLAQILDLPKDVTGNIRQFLNNEVKHYAILPIKQAALDFCKIKSSDSSGRRRVLIVATDGRKIAATVEALYNKGISIDVIEPAWMAYARACFENKTKKNDDTNLLFAMINKGILSLSLFKDKKLDFVRIQPIEPADTDSKTFPDWLAEQINAVMKFYEYGSSRQYNKWQVNVFAPEKEDIAKEKKDILKSRLAGNVTLDIQTSETAYLDNPAPDENSKNSSSAIAIGLAMKLLISGNDDLNINLVPSEAVLAKSRENKSLILANITAALMVVMILSIIFFNTKIAKVKAVTYKNNKSSFGHDTKLILEEQGELDKEIEYISDKLNNMTNVIQNDSVAKWGPILHDIGIAIPENTRLTSINCSESVMKLDGQSLNYDKIYHFTDSLNACESIKSATMLGTTNNGLSNGIVNYSISCVLNE